MEEEGKFLECLLISIERLLELGNDVKFSM